MVTELLLRWRDRNQIWATLKKPILLFNPFQPKVFYQRYCPGGAILNNIFQWHFFLSPTSCRNLRFSCKKCQKQPKIGTKIAKNEFFQKFWQNLNSPSSI